MDIVIAAAGKGTRLQQFTEEIPKHIIEIADRPFIFYLLDAVVAANFRRIIIVGGHHFEKLVRAIEDYETDSEIIVVNQFDKIGEDKYGTACPLLAAEDIIQGDRFLYTMGDHLLSVEDLERMQMSTRDTLMATIEHDHPERYGVVELEDNRVLRIIEKPKNPKSNSVNVGLYTLPSKIFRVVHNLKTSERGEYEITDAINFLAKDEVVRAVPLKGYWLDLGRPEDISSLVHFINNKQS
ncbi:MAG: sugar phosphate nucleotidyltransferase [bacterium]|nr:sugar phosphate nucleotidyltransferase [bacterium]